MTTLHIRPVVSTSETDLQGLCDVLLDCVGGGASVSFMLPITHDKAERFWQEVLASAERNERIVLVAEQDHCIVGTVQVIWATPENQPHRGDVAKMLVHRHARGTGVGAALLAAIEQTAAQFGKTLLVLDTVTDSAAYRLYQRHDWQRVGEIPNYALWPNGQLCPTTVFYKQLSANN